MTGGLAVPGARAVLFGTGGHIRGSKLEDLPSVDTTLDDLRDTLLDVCGMAPGHVVRVPAHAHAAEVVGAVEEATAADGGPVLFYYAGHGLLGPRDDLYLATRASRPPGTSHSPSPTARCRDLLGQAPSGSLVVLDCCFSGRAGASARAGRCASGLRLLAGPGKRSARSGCPRRRPMGCSPPVGGGWPR
ncbi:hypothetical protein SANTM175S_09122 [Streptomyces antimycoticus]